MEKRKLTSDEIEDILSQLNSRGYIKKDIADNIRDSICSNIREQIQNVEIFPDQIPKLKQKIFEEYYTSQISPGEHVGIMCAQNIGERCTQWTLDSFHYSGTTINTVVTGVPRFAELLNATKNPKNVVTNLYFNDKMDSIPSIRKFIGHRIQQLTFNDLVESYSISQKYKKWYQIYNALYDERYKKYNTCLSFKMNMEILFQFELELRDVAMKLEEYYDDIVCIFSPNCLGVIDVWVDTSNLELSNNINDVYIKESNKKRIYLDFVVYPNLISKHLYGIPDIAGISYKHENDERFIELLGFNIAKIFELDFVDKDRTYSNNMWEIYETFGIEATCEFLLKEFISVICSDSFVNHRHIQLLVDSMCYRGGISSISRYGVHVNESGPLTKASFEQSLDNFLKASLYNIEETTNGVSASIMCGKPSGIGTGLCDLIYKN